MTFTIKNMHSAPNSFKTKLRYVREIFHKNYEAKLEETQQPFKKQFCTIRKLDMILLRQQMEETEKKQLHKNKARSSSLSLDLGRGGLKYICLTPKSITMLTNPHHIETLHYNDFHNTDRAHHRCQKSRG
jgi:hypothetical protein